MCVHSSSDVTAATSNLGFHALGWILLCHMHSTKRVEFHVLVEIVVDTVSVLCRTSEFLRIAQGADDRFFSKPRASFYKMRTARAVTSFCKTYVKTFLSFISEK